MHILCITIAPTSQPGADSPTVVVPSTLAAFVQRRLVAVGLPSAAAVAAASQLAGLAAALPAEAARGWFRESGLLAADYLQREPSLIAALVSGQLDIAGVLRARAEHSQTSCGLFQVIDGHHGQLRQALGSGRRGVQVGESSSDACASHDEAAPSADPWPEAVDDDPEALRRYAAAAAQIGARAWVREGIVWAVEQARRHFCDGPVREAHKAAARRSWRERGGRAGAKSRASRARASRPLLGHRHAAAASPLGRAARVAQAALTAPTRAAA